MQFSSFELGDSELVRGRVRQNFVDLGFERPVPLFQIRKRLHRHSACLLNQWALNEHTIPRTGQYCDHDPAAYRRETAKITLSSIGLKATVENAIIPELGCGGIADAAW
jgi:hypothetical protein